MSNVNIKLHHYQRELIRKLSLQKGARFNELLFDNLESEHMNYHLKQIIDIGFVEKNGNVYILTDSGKDYSNLTDEETDLIEKQPKTSVIIHAKRKGKDGIVEHLLMKRLRQPYYGKVGYLTGKVRFGELLKEAAARELYEETGLKATTFHLERIYHKMRKREDGTWIQDVVFYIFLAVNIRGKLIKQTSFQENFWATKKELKERNYDTFDDFALDDNMNKKPLEMTEDQDIAKGF